MIYADNAATTKLSEKAKEALVKSFEIYGNPSSMHQKGVEAAELLSQARKAIANILNCDTKELYFTSGGTESNNWAIKGVAEVMKRKGKTHIISTKFEHHAVLHVLKRLEKSGYTVTYLDVYSDGYIKLEDLKSAITDQTGLVTIMFANNEIGTIQPIAEIGKICREKGIVFHTDGVQAVGHLPVDVKELNVDMLSFSAHKFGGPKMTGGLFIRKGVLLTNLIDGGAQERNKRAGTEDTAGYYAMSEALQEAVTDLEKKNEHTAKLRDKLIDGLLKMSYSRLNGGKNRLSGNVSVCFEGVEGEALLLMLDQKGICASSGSACTSGSLDPSHVLLALGLQHEVAHGSLRLSINHQNTEEEIDYIIKEIPPIINRLRDMSPVWEEMMKKEGKI